MAPRWTYVCEGAPVPVFEDRHLPLSCQAGFDCLRAAAGAPFAVAELTKEAALVGQKASIDRRRWSVM